MRKLVCTKCGMMWYTASASENEVCDNCGGYLEETDSEEVDEELHE